MATRLALFDLDDTLIDRASGFREWARAFVTERGLGGEAEVAWLEATDADWLVTQPDFLARIRSRYGLPESVEELLSAYRTDYPSRMPPPSPETAGALRRLRTEGWTIGIVTNGEPTQEVVIRGSGLGQLVDGWAVSSIAGVRKPDPAIFHAAATACALDLDGAVIVGDSPEADIAGAIACSLSSIWIARGREWIAGDYAPTWIADSVADAVLCLLGA